MTPVTEESYLVWSCHDKTQDKVCGINKDTMHAVDHETFHYTIPAVQCVCWELLFRP